MDENRRKTELTGLKMDKFNVRSKRMVIRNFRDLLQDNGYLDFLNSATPLDLYFIKCAPTG